MVDRDSNANRQALNALLGIAVGKLDEVPDDLELSVKFKCKGKKAGMNAKWEGEVDLKGKRGEALGKFDMFFNPNKGWRDKPEK